MDALLSERHLAVQQYVTSLHGLISVTQILKAVKSNGKSYWY